MNKKALWILLFMLILFNVKSFCTPAYPYPIEVTQSDKSVVTVTLKGDEKVSWAKSVDGFTLLRAENGDFVYAIADGRGGIKPSNVLAHNPNQRSEEEIALLATLSEDLFYSQEQIAYLKQFWAINQDFENRLSQAPKSTTSPTETYRMVVILMGFADLAFTTPRAEIDALFNQVGYSVNGNAGSIRDYFLASSAGKLSVEATVVGPYTAANNMAYYGQNYEGTHTDMHVRELVTEAVIFADPEVDFSQFTNGEGENVSCVYVIYAGVPESSGNNSNTIWPHRSRLYSSFAIDGVYVSDYGVSSEKQGSEYNPQPPTIGTICHEFSHVLGQADYYDTDYNEQGSFNDHDSWDLMCSGNYNNDGKCPPLWSAHEREVRGYIEIEELLAEGSNTLPPLHSVNKAYKMTISQNEYFLLENRQKVGWDYYLPGHGMLIFHVNKNVAGWNSNCANCNPNNPGMDLEEANPNSVYNRESNPFPGTSNRTSFTDSTNPNSMSYAGNPINRPITNIQENTSTGNIIFDYGAADATRPIVTTLSAIGFSDSISVAASIDNTQSLSIIERGVCFSDTTATPTVLCNTMTSPSNSNNFSIGLGNLQPDREYFVRAYAKTADKVGYGEIMKVKTRCMAELEFPFEDGFEQNNTTFDCWENEFGIFVTNTWSLTDTAYESGGISSAAEGSNWAFIRSDWTNGTQTTKLVTLPIDLSNINQAILSFSYAQKAKSGKQDKLKVYYKNSPNGAWTLLQSYNSNVSSWTTATISLPNTTNYYLIAFEATLQGGYGVCLDNVSVLEGDQNAFPHISTLSFDDLTDVSAKVDAALLSQGNNPVYQMGVCYATHQNPTIEDAVIIVPNADNFSVNLQSLEPNTTYYVRAFARNNGHLSYGEEIEFLTLCQRISTYPYNALTEQDNPCIRTNAWTFDSENNSYRFESGQSGSRDLLVLPIFDLEHFEDIYLCFDRLQAQSASSTIDTLRVLYRTNVADPWNELALFSNATTDYTRDSLPLNYTSSTLFIAFEGISNSSSLSVKNILVNATMQTPFVITNEPQLATYNSISVSGEVTMSGLSEVTSRGICWSVETMPTTADNTLALGSGIGTFEGTISNLQEHTTYYIRAFATNSYGTTYGQQFQISTPYTPILNNTISESQQICEGSIADDLQGSQPSGGSGTYTYQWIMSTDSIVWVESTMSSVSNLQDLEMRQLFATTYFARVVSSTFVSDTSNVVTILVSPASRGGNVFLVSDNPASGSELRLQLRASLGDVLYWEKRKEGYNYERIENSQDSIYLTDIPAEAGTWSYRAVVKSGTCEEATSGSLSVNVAQGVGLNDIATNKTTIKVSPNPSDGHIKIHSGSDLGKAKIEVISTDGKLVHCLQDLAIPNGETELYLGDLRSGSYVLRIYFEQSTWECVLIINR